MKRCLHSHICLGFLFLLAMLARAGAGPTFYVSNPDSGPDQADWLRVTTGPFGTTVITTNLPGGAVYDLGPPANTTDFTPGGALYSALNNLGELDLLDPTSLNTITNAGTHTSDGTEVVPSGFAFSAVGTMYLTDGLVFYACNPSSGLCTKIADWANPIYALSFAPNGTLFGIGFNVYFINPATAAEKIIGGPLPMQDGSSYINAKDTAFGSDGQLYMVGTDGISITKLYLVNTNKATLTVIGDLPFNASGLAAIPAGGGGGPSIYSEPASQTAAPGSNPTFSVGATGSGLVYQWFFDDGAYLHATNSSLTLTNVSTTNAGSYFVIITNSSGSVTSSVAVLTVTNATTSNTNSGLILATTGYGGSNAFTILSLATNPPAEKVLATGPFYTCLCFSPGGQLFGAGGTLNIVNTNTGASTLVGNIRTNGGTANMIVDGMAFSPGGVLYASYLNSLYIISTNTAQAALVGAFPSGTFVWGLAFAPDGTLYGGETSLYKINSSSATVTATIGPLTGSPAFILADMKYNSDGFLYFVESGATNGNLYRLNPANAQVSIVAAYGSVLYGLAFTPTPANSTPVKPSIVTQPANLAVPIGQSATFTVVATGTPPPQYQWQFGSTNLPGQTAAMLSLTSVNAAEAGLYRVIVSNSLGSVTSATATLAVYTPVVITQPPPDLIGPLGASGAFVVAATGSNLKYQWKFDGGNIKGATTAKYSFSMVGVSAAGTYTVVVSNAYSSATASGTLAIIPPAPTITSPKANATITNSTLMVSGQAAANAAVTSIQFTLNGGVSQTASGTLNWTANVTLAPGSNTFRVVAVNASGQSAVTTASFFYNQFAGVAGTYNGLFYDTHSPAWQNAGFLTLTLSANQTFSAKILLAGATNSVTGQFDVSGAAQFGVPKTPLLVSLQADLTGVSGQVAGTVFDSNQLWTASLTADLNATSTHSGNYTLAMSGGPNPAVAPSGYSYGFMAVTAKGGVTLTGSLADATALTAAGTLSKLGRWPLYAPLYKGNGLLVAWVNIASPYVTGNPFWFKNPLPASTNYPGGFSLDSGLGLVGDLYAPQTPVLNLTDGAAIFSDGNLAAPITNAIAIGKNNQVSVTSGTNHLTITLTGSSGLFSGSFIAPGATQPTLFKGALLPLHDAGYGYFLGPTQSGSVSLGNPGSLVP